MWLPAVDIDPAQSRQLRLTQPNFDAVASFCSFSSAYVLTLLCEATRDLVLANRTLGHRDVKSTQRYAHLTGRALARAVNGMW